MLFEQPTHETGGKGLHFSTEILQKPSMVIYVEIKDGSSTGFCLIAMDTAILQRLSLRCTVLMVLTIFATNHLSDSTLDN